MQPRCAQAHALAESGTQAPAPDRFEAVTIQTQGNRHDHGARAGAEFANNMVFQPAAQPIEIQVVSSLQLPSQFAKHPQRAFCLAPGQEQLAKIQQAIGLGSRYRPALTEQPIHHLQRASRTAAPRDALFKAGKR